VGLPWKRSKDEKPRLISTWLTPKVRDEDKEAKVYTNMIEREE